MTIRPVEIPQDAFVLVIGAMKSGTTTFFSHLTDHPAVARSRVNEPEYFSASQQHGIEVKRYDDLWDYDPRRHRYCAEASTGYSKYPHESGVPDRMRAAGIEPRFVYLVRDPVDRIESQYNHGRVRRTSWAYDDFFEPGLLDLSRYFMQLEQYLLRYPDRDRYRVVDFEQLISAPRRVMTDVHRWLDLDPVPVLEDRHENRTPEPSRLELLLDDLDLSAPLARVPARVKEGAKRALRRVAPGKRRMSGEERERARDYLRADILEFGREFEFPVEKWGFR